MVDVASTSAAHDGNAVAMVTRTRLVVAKHLAVMRMKSLLQYRRTASRTRAIKCLANKVGRGRKGTGSIGVSVGRRGGGTMAAERVIVPQQSR
ncbi:hypothetical protein [Bradyrhizobium canariense]|uniref:hypothetical protein n=1 Tax=Bradyrhizobium canariense TaxID=255045 RepID=UPI001B8A0B5E|nr:hypothetical protein [Bradyrhizobium canariense]MBR0949607.1 hypothetical protein [Bradyrhizobium canariense]